MQNPKEMTDERLREYIAAQQRNTTTMSVKPTGNAPGYGNSHYVTGGKHAKSLRRAIAEASRRGLNLD